MRRVGRVLTGVDRVERAYLLALQAAPEPLYGLIRSKYGYILLDPGGIAEMTPILSGHAGEDQSTRAWQVARRAAVSRGLPWILPRMLRRHVPAGGAYLNTGHSNVTDRVLQAMKRADMSIAVFIHDVIPLEFPDFQRDGSVAPFRAMMERVVAQTDLVIYNSKDTKKRAEAHMASRVPRSIVAHLGTDVVDPRPEDLPSDLPPEAPYFVTPGTIEPRKNHAFLLDLWDEMGADAPGLVFAGARGWKNEDVFSRLDALRPGGRIREESGLSDGALSALVSGAAGVLLPSHAEGFGLPAVEAAALGVPVVVNTLDVYAEFLGDIPIYADVSNRYLWIRTIRTLAEAGQRAHQDPEFHLPSWEAHFKTVLRLT